MDKLIQELKKEIIEALNLEDMEPDDIDADEALFGDGLGLDSIDALELIVLLEKNYGIKIENPKDGKTIYAKYVKQPGRPGQFFMTRSGEEVKEMFPTLVNKVIVEVV